MHFREDYNASLSYAAHIANEISSRREVCFISTIALLTSKLGGERRESCIRFLVPLCGVRVRKPRLIDMAPLPRSGGIGFQSGLPKLVLPPSPVYSANASKRARTEVREADDYLCLPGISSRPKKAQARKWKQSLDYTRYYWDASLGGEEERPSGSLHPEQK